MTSLSQSGPRSNDNEAVMPNNLELKNWILTTSYSFVTSWIFGRLVQHNFPTHLSSHFALLQTMVSLLNIQYI